MEEMLANEKLELILEAVDNRVEHMLRYSRDMVLIEDYNFYLVDTHVSNRPAYDRMYPIADIFELLDSIENQTDLKNCIHQLATEKMLTKKTVAVVFNGFDIESYTHDELLKYLTSERVRNDLMKGIVKDEYDLEYS